jgi:hypothetical protein
MPLGHGRPPSSGQIRVVSFYPSVNFVLVSSDVLFAPMKLPQGLIWSHFARPPMQGLDFEMDVHGVAHEFAI